MDKFTLLAHRISPLTGQCNNFLTKGNWPTEVKLFLKQYLRFCKSEDGSIVPVKQEWTQFQHLLFHFQRLTLSFSPLSSVFNRKQLKAEELTVIAH